MTGKRVAIIGGGATGIAAAHFLEEKLDENAGVEIVLFESTDRLGGAVRTVQKDGFVIEGGPDCFIADKPSPIRMAEKLGFDDDLVNTQEDNKGTFIYADGKLHRLPEGVMTLVPTKFWPFVTTSLFSWPGKIRMGMDLFIPRGRSDVDEPLASFVLRRLGREALEKLADPLVAGIHGSDPETMSLKATFPRFIDMEKNHRSLILASLAARKRMKEFQKKLAERPGPKRTFFVSFRYGMQELTDRMAEALSRTVVRLNTPVASVKPVDGGFDVITRTGERQRFDAVVMCAPAFAAAAMLADADPDMAAVLSEIPYSSSATVNFAFKKEKLGVDLKGFGFVVPSSAPTRVLAGTFASNKWPYRAPEGYVLIRAFVGGARKGEYAELPEADIEDLALKELRSILGITGDPEFSMVFRWPRSMPQYTIGHLERVERIARRAERIPGLVVTGTYLTGVGVGDCLNYGQKAAEEVVAFLSR